MDLFTGIKGEMRKKVVESWSKMSDDARSHFINQVSIGLSIWGSDDPGKSLVIRVLETMVNDGSQNLSDFGLYVGTIRDTQEAVERREEVRRASLIMDSYRLKNALPSEPHRELGL